MAIKKGQKGEDPTEKLRTDVEIVLGEKEVAKKEVSLIGMILPMLEERL